MTLSPVPVFHVSELEAQGIFYHQGDCFTFQNHRLRKGQVFAAHLREQAVALAEQYQAQGRFCLLVEQEGMLTLCREDAPTPPVQEEQVPKPSLLTVPQLRPVSLGEPYRHLSSADRQLAETLAQVRQTFARRQVQAVGLTWHYWVGGAGTQAILFLPGTVHWGDLWFRYLQAWQGEFRVIAPTYPPATRIEHLVAGLRQMLKQEQVGRVHLLGHSLGGMVALALVRLYPELVGHLVLSHTGIGAPGPERVQRARATERYLQRLTASQIAQQLYPRIAEKHLAAVPQRHFWQAYIREVLQGTSKTEFLHLHCRVVADFFQNYRFGPQELASFPGRVLLVSADNDTTFTPAEQAALQALFPQATTHICQGTGHYSVVVAFDQLYPRLTAFWQG
ncbi:MAG: alpha/beta hydrolase [Gloeomargarita sp. GMQP_bins_120]